METDIQAKRHTIFALGMAILFMMVFGGGLTMVRARVPSPERVVEDFFRWYVTYPGSPLADEAYHTRDDLTAACVRRVDETVASFERGGYDPFLCAQDRPGAFAVEEAEIAGGNAHVIVELVWNPETPYEFTRDLGVNLEWVEGQWRIAEIVCAQ
jgi:hypothetical protein